MYEQNHESSMDGFRAKLLRKIMDEHEKLIYKSNVDLARLPPCHSVLKPHLHRLPHRIALYKRADESTLEKPKHYDDGQEWIRTEDGELELLWSYGAAIPNSLVDVLDIGDREEEEEEENKEGRV